MHTCLILGPQVHLLIVLNVKGSSMLADDSMSKCILWSRTLYVRKYSSENFSLFPKIPRLRKSTSAGAVEGSLFIISLLFCLLIRSTSKTMCIGRPHSCTSSTGWSNLMFDSQLQMYDEMYKINYNPNVKAAVMRWRWWCETDTMRNTYSFRDYERTYWLCAIILSKYTGYRDMTSDTKQLHG